VEYVSDPLRTLRQFAPTEDRTTWIRARRLSGRTPMAMITRSAGRVEPSSQHDGGGVDALDS
jgi:hypothetical protein